MRRILVVLGSLVALVLGATGAQAITWGEPDGNDHPHVVTLLFVQAGVGYYSCTGTLLDSDTVLTAGHCTGAVVDGALEPNDMTWVSNHTDPLADYAPGSPGGIAAYLAASDHWVQGDAVPHPEYADYAQFPLTYDIGLVELDGEIDTEGVYGELAPVGFLDDTYGKPKGAARDRRVVVVGYGQQGTVPAFEQDDYIRYVGESTIMGFGKSSYQSTQTVQLSNSPGKGNGSGGTCFGDSGGPAFWVDPATGEETNIVVAITSYGITGQCAGTDFSFRTDIETAHDFVNGDLG